MAMYVRIKRKHQTIFQTVNPSDSFLSLKEKISPLVKEAPEDIQLWASVDQQKELADLATLADQDIGNDAVVYMVFKLSNSEAFEPMDISVAVDTSSSSSS